MKTEQSLFYSKILLFGEYTIIFNSKALTIPYTYFTGQLSFMDFEKYTRIDKATESNKHLRSYYFYLLDNKIITEKAALDIERFKEDIESGLYFESNIPQGYGVGSSGALVAAIYKRYSASPIAGKDNDEMQQLKSIFSSLESYFHGTSSGMDPLNCYIGKPLLVHNENFIEKVKVPHRNNNRKGAVFLINSEYPGNTGPLVEGFLKKAKNKSFEKKVQQDIIPLNDTCITQLVGGDIEGFFHNLKRLSLLQLKEFKEMIPESFNNVWEEGLESEDYYLKLCGSGGGGFLLGFTGDYNHTEKIMKKNGIDIMPVFKKIQ